MKFLVNIEEVVCETFEIEAESHEEALEVAREKYDSGEIVLEPFAGIGSTIIAAKNLGRKCVGCEIDEKYAEIVVDRLKNNNNSEQIELF